MQRNAHQRTLSHSIAGKGTSTSPVQVGETPLLQPLCEWISAKAVAIAGNQFPGIVACHRAAPFSVVGEALFLASFGYPMIYNP